MNMGTAVLDRVETAIGIVEGTWEQVPSVRFAFVAPMLRAYEASDGKKYLDGVASSTSKDLHGDTMEESALADMERDANDNLTIFLNHEYNVPEDVAGSVVRAKMARRGADQDGEPNWDLDYTIEIDQSNDRAVKAWTAVKAGRKLGLSIGAMIPSGGALRNKKDGSLRIQHVKLLETSIVGIPANQRSWLNLAKSAIETEEERLRRDAGRMAKAGTTVPIGSPTLTLDGNEYHIRGQIEGLTLSGEAEIGGSPEPDVEESRVRIIEIDTDPAPADSGGSSSDDESTDDSEEETLAGDPEVTASETPTEPTGTDEESGVTALEQSEDPSLTEDQLEALVVAGLGDVVRVLTAALDENDRLRKDLAEETARRESAEQALTTLNEETGDVIRTMVEIIQRVGDLPLSRKSKAVQGDAQETLRARLSGLYSETILKQLFQGDAQ